MLSCVPSRRQLQRTVVAIGLVVLIALSGCAGLSDTDSSTPGTADPTTSTPTGTQTPTASPTTPNTTVPEELPAGLNDTGVQNVTQVIRSHRTSAIKTPGVVTHETDTKASDISVVASVRVAADTNLTRVQYVSQAQRTTENGTRNTTTAITANETAVRQYTVTEREVTLDNRRNRSQLFDRALRGLSTARSGLQGTLQRGNFTVSSGETLDGTTTVTLQAGRYAGGQRYDAENVVTYNATVRLTADGLIRSATERIVAVRDGTESRYSFTYEFNSQSVDLPRVPQVPANVQLESGDTSDG